MQTQSKIYSLGFYAILGLVLLLCSLEGGAQEITQTIKGQLIDQDSKSPLIGATIQVARSDPILGNITDIDGNFKITNVPIGRVTLKLSYVGYEEKYIPNLLITSSKEVILNVSMEESFESLNEVRKIQGAAVSRKSDFSKEREKRVNTEQK